MNFWFKFLFRFLKIDVKIKCIKNICCHLNLIINRKFRIKTDNFKLFLKQNMLKMQKEERY